MARAGHGPGRGAGKTGGLAARPRRLLDFRAVMPARRVGAAGADQPRRRLPWWPALLVALLGLGALYADALRTGFLNDDYLFLEEARSRPLLESLARLGALANYYRPLSRQLYFELLTPLAGGSPLVFHLVNAALFTTALVLLADLLLALLPVTGALAGTLYFALLPLQRVNLIWISCSQDLLALVLVLASVALFRRGRDAWACLAYLGALASKETSFPLPAVLAGWMMWSLPQRGATSGANAGAIGRRLVPFAVTAAAWLAVVLWVRSRNPATAAFLHATPLNFVAAIVHEVQSLLGLEHPAGMARALLENAPALVPLVSLAALALWIGPGRAPAGAEGVAETAGRRILLFAALWLTAFALPVGPVVHAWSAYYYTVAAVGGALAMGYALRKIDRWGWLALTALLLWWHAGSNNVRAFAISDRPWGWTSHLTAFYFQRGAALTDSLSIQLRRLEPTPPHGTRFFFATLPPWAGFQTGNGALIRNLYRDSTLASYFYSQFSDTTAEERPSRFLYWDGVQFAPLYSGSNEPWFQVGSDLLLFGRPAGAAHAFRRGLESGEARTDHVYWLGWAELWNGRRTAAEAAWQAFGARDDSSRYHDRMLVARDALIARDTLAARRALFEAIQSGIGHADPHAALGELLEGRQLKYALLELRVAGFLNPRDVRARRRLVEGLVRVRLDEPARRELESLIRIDPGWSADSALVAARRELDRRSNAGIQVMEF